MYSKNIPTNLCIMFRNIEEILTIFQIFVYSSTIEHNP